MENLADDITTPITPF